MTPEEAKARELGFFAGLNGRKEPHPDTGMLMPFALNQWWYEGWMLGRQVLPKRRPRRPRRTLERRSSGTPAPEKG